MQTFDTNPLAAARAAVCAVCAAFSAAFGTMGWLVLAWVCCMALDWITGTLAAAQKGEWSSAAARAGIRHKAGMVFVVIASGICDGVLRLAAGTLPEAVQLPYAAVVLPVVLVWYIFTELGSTAENAAAMGAPVPAVLLKTLAAAKTAAEKEG